MTAREVGLARWRLKNARERRMFVAARPPLVNDRGLSR